VTAADGERVDFPGLGNRFVLPPERADGRLAIVEHTIAPRTLAGPLHVHEHEDEYSYVLAGRKARYGLTMDFDSIARLSEQHGFSA
jgi:hypothetical protein